jgi:hypothetical protein
VEGSVGRVGIVRGFLGGWLGLVSLLKVEGKGEIKANGEFIGQKDEETINGESSFVDACGEYTLRVRGLRETSPKEPVLVETQEEKKKEKAPPRTRASPEEINMGVSEM